MPDIDWLLDETLDVQMQIDNFSLKKPEPWRYLRLILQYKLKSNSVNKLWKKLADTNDDDHNSLRLASIKVLISGTATFNHFKKDLWLACLRHNVWLDVRTADFNQTAQIAFAADPQWVEFNPDIVFLYETARNLPVRVLEGNQQALEDQINQVMNFAKKFQENYGAVTMFNTMVASNNSYLSDVDLTTFASERSVIANYNLRLAEVTVSSDHFIFDLARLAESIGTLKWGNTNYWHLAKMPFDPSCTSVFCDRFASLLAAYRGKSRRLLVLDCDNTLWGGVIGDDGIDGIKIGQGSASGEAFVDIQRMALRLRERGIVLAVSSKNTEEVALKVFREHPDMLLRENHIAAFRINWIDKAANIEEIAKTLDLGLQSFVFLDDNPAERERVRKALPEVAVPEVGSNPADYPSILAQAGYFNTTFFSAEDQNRADMYVANAKRTEVMNALGDFDKYLKSLNMKISLRPFDSIGRPRITQLIAKSNQFNLTTMRLTNSEVESFEVNEDVYDLQIRLLDRFGDNGMVSVVMAQKATETWTIIMWLMSCRVLVRRVEEYVLANLAKAALAHGAKRLIGKYIPTDRNHIVVDHYKKLGFSKIETLDSGEEIWQLNLETYIAPDLPFEDISEANE